MVKLTNISHSYGTVPVLKDFSLTLEPGQRIALMGPSGVGKTTVLRIVMGLLKPQQGEVEKTFEKEAVVFQEPRLLPWRTAGENVNLVLGDTDAMHCFRWPQRQQVDGNCLPGSEDSHQIQPRGHRRSRGAACHRVCTPDR